jgi:hypothetical protein
MTKQMNMLVQGDDNAMAHTSKLTIDWVKGMAEFGFESEALYRNELNELEFCSSRVYTTTEGPCFGPKPGKVLAKFGYIANPPKGVTRESLMRGVALGLQKQVNFIPPLARLVERVLELTSGHEAKYINHWFCREAHKMTTKCLLGSTAETDYELYNQYLWTCSDQQQFEAELQSMHLGSEWSFSTLASLCDRDTSGDQMIF